MSDYPVHYSEQLGCAECGTGEVYDHIKTLKELLVFTTGLEEDSEKPHILARWKQASSALTAAIADMERINRIENFECFIMEWHSGSPKKLRDVIDDIGKGESL